MLIYHFLLCRKVLEFGVLTWSLATWIYTWFSFVKNFGGIGEGISPPAATDLIARTIPLEERSRAVAFVFGGLSVGGFLLAPPLIQNLGWELVFYIFSSLGIAWNEDNILFPSSDFLPSTTLPS